MRIKPYSRKVDYYETDQMGVVHHSNYIRWFEEARLDYMDQAGLSYAQMEESGLVGPVLSCSCTYKKAVRFPQKVTIDTLLVEFTGMRFRMVYQVLVEGERQPVAVGETTHCFADKEMVPVRLDKRNPEIYDRMLALIVEHAVGE